MKEKRVPISEILEAVTDFIPYYNNERPTASNGGLSPVQFRLQNPMGTYLILIEKKVIDYGPQQLQNNTIAQGVLPYRGAHQWA